MNQWRITESDAPMVVMHRRWWYTEGGDTPKVVIHRGWWFTAGGDAHQVVMHHRWCITADLSIAICSSFQWMSSLMPPVTKFVIDVCGATWRPNQELRKAMHRSGHIWSPWLPTLELMLVVLMTQFWISKQVLHKKLLFFVSLLFVSVVSWKMWKCKVYYLKCKKF